MDFLNKRVKILTGHNGSGKTNIAVNMAFRLVEEGSRVCLVDLDIVNPYFRAKDMSKKLEEAGIRVIAPLYAGTNLDIPALPGEIYSVFENPDSQVILDIGGDDTGAAALGRFSRLILEENNYEHYYVINARRALTTRPDEAAEVLREIEGTGRVPATALINNTNLGAETDAGVVKASLGFAGEVSEITGLPIAFTAVRKGTAARLKGEIPDIFPVEIYVNPPWQ